MKWLVQPILTDKTSRSAPYYKPLNFIETLHNCFYIAINADHSIFMTVHMKLKVNQRKDVLQRFWQLYSY